MAGMPCSVAQLVTGSLVQCSRRPAHCCLCHPCWLVLHRNAAAHTDPGQSVSDMQMLAVQHGAIPWLLTSLACEKVRDMDTGGRPGWLGGPEEGRLVSLTAVLPAAPELLATDADL